MKDDNDQGKDQPEATGPRHETSSTETATRAAIPSQGGDSDPYEADQPVRMTNTADLPTLGEQDGVFYFMKHQTGQDEVPEQTHRDNYVELCRMALNNSWRPDEETARVAQSAKTEGGWDVLYAVDVEPNEARG